MRTKNVWMMVASFDNLFLVLSSNFSQSVTSVSSKPLNLIHVYILLKCKFHVLAELMTGFDLNALIILLFDMIHFIISDMVAIFLQMLTCYFFDHCQILLSFIFLVILITHPKQSYPILTDSCYHSINISYKIFIKYSFLSFLQLLSVCYLSPNRTGRVLANFLN